MLIGLNTLEQMLKRRQKYTLLLEIKIILQNSLLSYDINSCIMSKGY